MDIIISNSSTVPIYGQIGSQIETLIMTGRLQAGDRLPSIRALANDLRISAITTKRAYAELEAKGFIESVPGKGCFVAGGNAELIREQHLRRIEGLLQQAADEACNGNISKRELRDMVDLILESEDDG